jgi:hypothetical protein
VQTILSRLVEAAYPDARRDGAAAPEPARSLRLIGLVRALMDYGRQLIVTARRCAGTPDFLAFARPFGTTHLNQLIARFGCAMSRAAHLEQKLERDANLGAHGQPAPRRTAPTARGTRARQPAQAARPPVRRAAPNIDPAFAGLPSVAQIAAEIRCRPLQVVIATICRDLGITPEHALWQQLNRALAAFGVQLSVATEHHDPRRPRAEASTASTRPAAPAERSPLQLPGSTGPPAPAEVSIAA